MDSLVKCVANVVLFAVAIIVEGWVAMAMWKWFVVPLGAMEIGLAHTIGLILLVSMVVRSHGNSGTETAELMVKSIIASILFVGMGAIVKASM